MSIASPGRWAKGLGSHADGLHLALSSTEPISGLATLLLLFSPVATTRLPFGGVNKLTLGEVKQLLLPAMSRATTKQSARYDFANISPCCERRSSPQGLLWDGLGLGGPTLSSLVTLRALSLPGLSPGDLSVVIPGLLWHLPSLHRLDLAGHDTLFGQGWLDVSEFAAGLCRLTELTHLDLSGCYLDDNDLVLISGSFHKLSLLGHLDLGENKLKVNHDQRVSPSAHQSLLPCLPTLKGRGPWTSVRTTCRSTAARRIIPWGL